MLEAELQCKAAARWMLFGNDLLQVSAKIL